MRRAGRTLTGAWIETIQLRFIYAASRVAPSRVRGLKLYQNAMGLMQFLSHPHGCVD